MATKPTSPSWRTLMRQAKEAEAKGHPRKAVALRQKASKLRRDARAAARYATSVTAEIKAARKARKKKPLTPRSEGGIDRSPPKYAIYPGFKQALLDGSASQDGGTATLRTDMPVQSPEHALAERVIKLARKKDGLAKVTNELWNSFAAERAETSKRLNDAVSTAIIDVARRMDEKIVCGFIAEINAAEQQFQGLPPDMTFNVSSLTVVKLIDALNRAGYTGKGRINGADREEKRAALMGKAHTEIPRFRNEGQLAPTGN